MITALDLLIPVYKNAILVANCIESIAKYRSELTEYSCRVIVINDSPGDERVSKYLEYAKQRGFVDLVLTNDHNLGFVKSVNRGLALARERKASVVLINSDTVTYSNTIREMLLVADRDEQIAFVCPRSNNASICTFPSVPHNRAGITLDSDSCYEAWKTVYSYLPRYTFSPTAVGFYMLIKNVVIENFGGLDEAFGVGYEEENDLVLRANKVGFRAVLANHAFAYHAGSASFLLQDIDLDTHRTANLGMMTERHPEFLPLIRKYQDSSVYRSEQMLRNLVPDEKGKLNLVLNLIEMGQHHNGTNELILNVLYEIDKADVEFFNITILTTASASAFHEFEKLKTINVVHEIRDSYAIAISFGQPYNLHNLNVMGMLAPINVYGMLDTISWDCGYLSNDQNIDAIWDFAAANSNGLFFISEYSKQTFLRRFTLGRDTQTHARLLPTKLSAYRGSVLRDEEVARKHVFVAGNHYAHKDSMRTGRQLAAAFPSLHFFVMGDGSSKAPNISSQRSGTLSDEAIATALIESSVIVLPSYYEGFGFSLMHALALGKPIVARDIPVTREILAKFNHVSGVVLFSRNEDLPDALRSAFQSKVSRVDDTGSPDWQLWTEDLVKFLKALVDPNRVFPLLKERTESGDALRRAGHLSHERLSSVDTGSSTASRVSWDDKVGRVRFQDLTVITNEDFVEFLYRDILGREPDEGGRLHHLTLLVGGVSRSDMLASFLANDEFSASKREIYIDGLQGGTSFWKKITGLIKA